MNIDEQLSAISRDQLVHYSEEELKQKEATVQTRTL